jgi:hypothetical protein
MLVHISTLQRIVYLAHYDKDKVGGNPRAGWTEILVLQDFANLMSPEVQISTSILATIWGDNWDDLGKEERAVTSVDNAIDQLRKDVLAALLELD